MHDPKDLDLIRCEYKTIHFFRSIVFQFQRHTHADSSVLRCFHSLPRNYSLPLRYPLARLLLYHLWEAYSLLI